MIFIHQGAIKRWGGAFFCGLREPIKNNTMSFFIEGRNCLKKTLLCVQYMDKTYDGKGAF